MYAKLIICTVDPTFKERFSLAQTAWSECSDCNGFESQFGGWDVEHERAIILSYWKNEKSLLAFMRDKHDELALKSMQAQTYKECTITYLRQLSQIASNNESEAFRPDIMRMTDCHVFPERSQHFLDMQTSIWNTGMQMSEGFCGGTLWNHDKEPHRYYMTTLWSTLAKHTQYVQHTLPRLKIESDLTQTVSKVKSFTVALQKDWEFTAT